MGLKHSKPQQGGKKGGFLSYFKNHCPGCEKNYSVFNVRRKTRKCEYDGNIYCKVCTKEIILPREKDKKRENMVVCFHCELLVNKSNRSVVEKFSNQSSREESKYTEYDSTF